MIADVAWFTGGGELLLVALSRVVSGYGNRKSIHGSRGSMCIREYVACIGGWHRLLSKINIILYVVLIRIAMVAEVAWFTGGWGL